MQLTHPTCPSKRGRDVRRRRLVKTGAATLLLIGSLAAPGLIYGSEPTQVGVRLGYYQQIDNGGIAQVDENGNVFQALVLVDIPVSDRDRIHARVLTDVVSSASITRAHNSSWRASQSGASGAVHVDGRVGYSHQFDNWDLSVGASASWDYAYRSLGANMGLGFSFLDKTANLRIGLSGFYDTLAMIRFNGEDEADQNRWTIGATLGWSHILGPKTVLDTSIAYTTQGGFLAAQFNSVFFGARELSEELPGARNRLSFTARIKQGIGDHHTIEAGARYYHDDWNIDAMTATTGYSVYLDAAHRVLLHGGYRFYIQWPSDYFQKSFAADANVDLRTSDPDLGGFIGHMGTLRLTFADLFGDETGELDIEGNYYYRTSGLDMFWFALGYRFTL